MSFYNHIMPLLGPGQEDNSEFYVEAMTDALNNWLLEIEGVYSKPTFTVLGTVMQGTTPVPVNVTDGFLIPIGLRFEKDEIKSALWCGDPSLSFINLFTTIGKKISQNFSIVGTNLIKSSPMPIKIPTDVSFATKGEAFNMAMYGVKTPVDFHKLLSDSFNDALRTTLVITSQIIGGIYLGTPMSAGSILINLSKGVLE